MEDAAKINTAHREAVYFLQVLLTFSLSDPNIMHSYAEICWTSTKGQRPVLCDNGFNKLLLAWSGNIWIVCFSSSMDMWEVVLASTKIHLLESIFTVSVIPTKDVQIKCFSPSFTGCVSCCYTKNSYQSVRPVFCQWAKQSLTQNSFLQQKVTKGARHKIVISILKLKERQHLLRSLEKVSIPHLHLLFIFTQINILTKLLVLAFCYWWFSL